MGIFDKFNIEVYNQLVERTKINGEASNMKKKLITALLATSVMSTMFSGCSVSTSTGSTATTDTSTKTESKTTDEATGEEVEITWLFWDDLEATEDLITIGYKQVIDRFNEEYKGKYHVKAITTNLAEYPAKLNALVAAGDVPDVFTCDPGPMLTQYVEAGATADLTDILQNQESEWYGTFSDGIFERLTYDGKIMAVPTCFAAACVFYNTEIFKEVGVEVPETYDQLIDVCKKIKEAGYAPISCSAGTAWCLGMIGGYLCDREGGPDKLKGINDGTLDWTSETFINAGKKLKELSQYFQESAAGDANDIATAHFYNGEAAMLVQGSWAIGQINGSNPAFEEKCGVFRFPGIEGGADPNRMIVKTDNLCMSSKTEHPEACIALMKMFTDDTSEKYIAEVGGKIPVTNVEFDVNKAPKQLSFIQDILSKTTGTLGFYNESLINTEAGDTFNNACVDIFLGTATPEEAFQKIQDHYDKKVRNK